MFLLMKCDYYLFIFISTYVNILYLWHIDLAEAIKSDNIVIFFLKDDIPRFIYRSLVNLV